MSPIRDEDDTGVAFDDVIVVRYTDRAALYDFGDFEYWVPHSCIHEDSELFYVELSHTMSYDDPSRLVVQAWFARREGLS